MFLGLYFNILICFVISGGALASTIFIYKKYANNLPEIFFAGFWFFVFLDWFFLGIDLILLYFGRQDLTYLVFRYFVQPSIYLQIVSGTYFTFYHATKNKILSTGVLIAFFLLSLVGLYAICLPGGLALSQTTYFTLKKNINFTTNFIFVFMSIPNIILMLVDLLKNFYYWIGDINKFEQKYFFSYFAILIYCLVGGAKILGFFSNWIEIFFELAIILSFYINYLAFREEEYVV